MTEERSKRIRPDDDGVDKKESSEGSAKKSRGKTEDVSLDVVRLRDLFRDQTFLHPMGPPHLNFCDLAHAVALCCGLAPEHGVRLSEAQSLAQRIGGTQTKHLVLVLCDGMGQGIIERHLDGTSFIARYNDPGALVAVFPSTTPAALVTLATGAWPGQHGQPGWDLRDQKHVEYPTKRGLGTVQIRCLDNEVADMRTNQPIGQFGFSEKDVYVEEPWTNLGESQRRMHFVSAYNGTGFSNWYEGPHKGHLVKLEETVSGTYGTPGGSTTAINIFAQGVDAVVAGVKQAEEAGVRSYSYMYSAHPDKHMHALGTEHAEVTNVMKGFDAQLDRLWTELRQTGLDVAMVFTADHGHVTVSPSAMVSLPQDLLDLLEYANIGVHGKGRHALFHVRCGLVPLFRQRWLTHGRLCKEFLLLTIEEAASEGLFGPFAPRVEVRPRLGDLVAISLTDSTLVTPEEAAQYRDGPNAMCRGAHGSLAATDMRIPFLVCRSSL